FSPDGGRIASGGADETVKVWSLARSVCPGVAARPRAEAHELAVLGDPRLQHWDEVRCVAVSPDGKLIASGGNDHVIRLWDASTGQEVRVLTGHHGDVVGVVFLKELNRLASASWDGTVWVWEVTTGKVVRTLRGRPFGPEQPEGEGVSLLDPSLIL